MIKRFYVKGLFGNFDNEIVFRDGGITVIVGQNGCGKTTMLQMLAAIFSNRHNELFRYKFDYVELDIEEHTLKIEPIYQHIDEDGINIRCLKYSIDSKELNDYYKENNRINSPSFWTRAIPTLRRISEKVFRDVRSGEILTLPEVIDEYFDELPEEIKNDIIVIPSAVYELTQNMQVELLTTDRLIKIYSDDEYRGREVVSRYTVEKCSDDLKTILRNTLSEYANISQKLDEKFPSKILEAIKQHKQFTEAELKQNIEIIDEFRKKYVQAGVLEENNDRFLNIDVKTEGLDESTAAILTVYYQDMKTKFESLNYISDRIVLFKNMLDNKLSKNKEIVIDKEEGITIVQRQKKETIELRYLSSGEQQELVLLYNLIFKGGGKKIVLLDEPEISLNVSWQREFLDDMKKIVNMNGFSIVIATHSPQIINENWDLVETLGELE